MVELQVISKVLRTSNASILTIGGISSDHFVTYSAEYNFIIDHIRNHGNVPDVTTFADKFPDLADTIFDVAESDSYLVEKLNEEYLYRLIAPVINETHKLLSDNSVDAVTYLQSQIPNLLPKLNLGGTDIILDAASRYEDWKVRLDNPQQFLIPTGFQEVDELIGGIRRGEELFVVLARTGEGKTWVLLKILEHSWKLGLRVGLIEPEMSANSVGYRFDTLNSHFSNTNLTLGKPSDGYEEYIKTLASKENPFIVARPSDFQKKITVAKLRAFVESNRIDILGIDGIGYLIDERGSQRDSESTTLTNISEDLMELSNELKIPILVVVQSNREGAKVNGAPKLEHVRNSDGIAHNATTVLSLTQRGPGLEFQFRKRRNGPEGAKFTYMWDIDHGIFNYVPDDEYIEDDAEKIEQIKFKFGGGKEVF